MLSSSPAYLHDEFKKTVAIKNRKIMEENLKDNLVITYTECPLGAFRLLVGQG